jgi:uncharacterized membrane protein YdfJ with MMPL/SSD domain
VKVINHYGDEVMKVYELAAETPSASQNRAFDAVEVISAAAPYSGQSQRLVHHLRRLPGDVLVAGAAAPYVDLQHSLGSHLPLALAIVAALTIVILFVMTGLLILQLKAARGSRSLPRGSRACGVHKYDLAANRGDRPEFRS